MVQGDNLITIRLKDDDTLDKLYKIAEQESMTRNKIINDILDDFFKDYIIKEDGTIEYIGTGQ